MTDKPSRGRPRQFSPDAALADAAELFRRQGYAATSLDDLGAVTGLKRSSLYAAFGSKQELYLQALDAHAGMMRDGLERAFRGACDIRQKLSRFFEGAVDAYFEDESGLGCLVLCTAPAEAYCDAPVRARLNAVLAMIDATLTAHLRAAAPDGPVPPEVLARMTSSWLHSLALRVRAGLSREDARRHCADMISALPL